MKQHTLDVPGISCGHCVRAISRAVAQLDGVASVDVDVATKTVTVVGDTARDDICTAIGDAGYQVAG